MAASRKGGAAGGQQPGLREMALECLAHRGSVRRAVSTRSPASSDGAKCCLDAAHLAGCTGSCAVGRPLRPPGDAADVELVGGVAAGSSSALADLYDRWGRRAYSLARRVCADEALAEDVVQEVFVALWRDPGRFDPARGSFGTWLLTLVHHKAVDAVRRESAAHRRGERVEAGLATAASTGEPIVGGADQAALDAVEAGQVRDALAKLSWRSAKRWRWPTTAATRSARSR
jgi:RNA polymerase sigma factor (sigma-70 family)